MPGTDTLTVMTRKERERERHRREIIRAAERIFGTKGYHATTIEEIAKEAEFAVGTLYNLFKGKEEIYTRVIESFVQQFLADFEQKVLGEADPEEAIGALIQLRLAHFEEHREFIRIALEASPGCRMDAAQALPPHLASVHTQYIEAVAGIFRRGMERGVFDGGDPIYKALCLEGIINAFVAYWSKNPPSERLEVRVAKMKREFVERVKLRLSVSPEV